MMESSFKQKNCMQRQQGRVVRIETGMCEGEGDEWQMNSEVSG